MNAYKFVSFRKGYHSETWEISRMNMLEKINLIIHSLVYFDVCVRCVYVLMFLCVKMDTHVLQHLYRGQKSTPGAFLYRPPCLRQDLFLFISTCAGLQGLGVSSHNKGEEC